MKIKRGAMVLSAAMLAAGSYADSFGTGPNQFSVDFVLVSNPGNIGETHSYDPWEGGIQTFGSVNYYYRIGKYEVTIEQFSKARASDSRIGDGDEDYWNTTVVVGPNAPATHVSWHEAAMFANWLTTGDAYNGAYLYNSSGTLTNVDRIAAMSTYGTVYVLPTEDEWYKAAYFKADGSGYTLYASGGSVPTMGTGGENYGNVLGKPWSVGSGTAFSIENNGTYDMSGNVYEWHESAWDGNLDLMTESRIFRGGAFYNHESFLQSTNRPSTSLPTFEAWAHGFRIVAISPPPVLVENLRVSQRQGTKLVDIYYDLDVNDNVSLAISNGTGAVAASSAVGDLGSVLAGIDLHVEWDGEVDWNGNSTNLQFTLTNSDGSTTFSTNVDFRDYSLDVSSGLGSPLPAVGTHVFPWRSTVTSLVQGIVTVGGTNYSCSGWNGTGSVPILGASTNTGSIILDDVSSTIQWKWIVDVDSDQMPDDWAQLYFGDTVSAVAMADNDNDGYLNWQEYILGSDPTNSGSSFLFQPSTSQPLTGEFSVDFTTAPGRLYTVECATDLISGNWEVFTNFFGDGSTAQVIDPEALPSCFYNVKILWVE
jgi:hypothetical protein